MKRFSLSILFVLAFGRTALATTFFVDAVNGNNSNSCTAAQTAATAKKSFGNFGGNGAISCMSAGDTLTVRAGTYPEAVYIGSQPYPGLQQSNPPVPNGVDDSHRTTIQAFPGEHPVITGQDVDNGGVLTIHAQFIDYSGVNMDGLGQNETGSGLGGNSVQNASFHDFEMKNVPSNAIIMTGIDGAFTHVHFTRIKIHDGPIFCPAFPGPHVYYLGSTTGPSTDVVIDSNEIYNWNCAGFNNAFVIQIYQSGGPPHLMTNYQVINNYIHDNNQSAGAIGTGDNYIIANNVVARNGSLSVDPVGGFDIGFNETDNPLIANNTFIGNAGYATGNGGFGTIVNARFSNNIMFGNGNNDQVGRVFQDPNCCTFTEDHNLQGVDPLFVNAAGNDYHLTSGSPAVGAGTDLSSFFTTDKDGLIRVAPWSIGAYVVGGGGPQPLTITTTSLPNGAVGSSYSATVTAIGGTPPYTWSATGLPAGLTMSSSGVISGTPTMPGLSSVTVSVTDAMPTTVSKPLTLTVATTGTTLTMSVNSGPCTLGGTLTIPVNGTGWSFPGVTVSTATPPATCTVKIHDNSTSNPAPDLISQPFTVTADVVGMPTLQFTQQPTTTVSGHAFAPPVAGTRQ